MQLVSTVVSLSAFADHTCALLVNGTVVCWGHNNFGQLGDKSMVDRAVPVMTYGINPGAGGVSTGAAHSCAMYSHSCPPGWFGPSPFNCSVCTVGSFSVTNNSVMCARCTAGMVSGVIGATANSSCTYCESGYEPAANQSICIPCQAGQFSNSSTSNGLCTWCPAGSTPAFNSSLCELCPQNHFSTQFLCSHCPPGMEPGLPGRNSCVSCSVGQSRIFQHCMHVCHVRLDLNPWVRRVWSALLLHILMGRLAFVVHRVELRLR